MDKDIKSFRVLSFAKRNLTSYGEIYLVETTPQNNELTRTFLDDMCVTDEFRLASNSSLIEDVKHAYEGGKPWHVDMSSFQTKDDIPDVNGHIGIRIIHDELIEMDEDEFEAMLEKQLNEMDQSELKAIIDKAFKDSILKQMGLDGVENWKTYHVVATTLKDGYVYANHNFDSLLAVDEEDAYNVMLSTISTKERRPIRPSDILSYVILPKEEKPIKFDMD